MSNLMESIYNKAKSLGKNIVLPESEDKRVVEAAALCAQQNIAKITLLGDENKIKAENPGIDLTGVTVINPETNKKTNEYAQLLFNLRQGKINKKTGLPEYATVEDAEKAIKKDYTMYGALMLKSDDVDGMVSGACHSTANTLRPGLQVIKTDKNTPIVSAYFLMVAPEGGNQYC